MKFRRHTISGVTIRGTASHFATREVEYSGRVFDVGDRIRSRKGGPSPCIVKSVDRDNGIYGVEYATNGLGISFENAIKA